MSVSVAYSMLQDENGSMRDDSVLFSVQEEGQSLRSILLRASAPFHVLKAFFPSLKEVNGRELSTLSTSVLLSLLLNGSYADGICMKIFPIDVVRRLGGQALTYEGIKHILQLCHGFCPSVECVMLDGKTRTDEEPSGDADKEQRQQLLRMSESKVELEAEDLVRIEAALKQLRDALMERLTSSDTSVIAAWNRLVETFDLADQDGCEGIAARIKNIASADNDEEHSSTTEVRLLVDTRRCLEHACARQAAAALIAKTEEAERARASAGEGEIITGNGEVVFRSVHDPSRELRLPAHLVWPLLVVAEALGCDPVARELTHGIKSLSEDEGGGGMWMALFHEWSHAEQALAAVAALQIRNCRPAALPVPAFIDGIRREQEQETTTMMTMMTAQKRRPGGSAVSSPGEAETTREEEEDCSSPESTGAGAGAYLDYRQDSFGPPQRSDGAGVRRGPYLPHPHPRHHHHYMDHSDTEQEDEDTSSDEEERPLQEAPSFSFLSVSPPASAFSGGQADSPLPPPLPCETIPLPYPHPHESITLTSPAQAQGQAQGQAGISSGGRAGTGVGPYARIDELVAERRAREREGGTPSTAISSSSGHGERMGVASPAGESEEEEETARAAAPSPEPVSAPRPPVAMAAAVVEGSTRIVRKARQPQQQHEKAGKGAGASARARVLSKPPLPRMTSSSTTGAPLKQQQRKERGQAVEGTPRTMRRQREEARRREDELDKARSRALTRVQASVRRKRLASESVKAAEIEAAREKREQRSRKISAYIHEQSARAASAPAPVPVPVPVPVVKQGQRQRAKGGAKYGKKQGGSPSSPSPLPQHHHKKQPQSLALREGWDDGCGDGAFHYSLSDEERGGAPSTAASARTQAQVQVQGVSLFPSLPATPPRDTDTTGDASALHSALGIAATSPSCDAGIGIGIGVQLSPQLFESPARLAVRGAISAVHGAYSGLSHSPITILPSPSPSPSPSPAHRAHVSSLSAVSSAASPASTSQTKNGLGGRVAWLVVRAWGLPEALGACVPYVVLEWGTLGRGSTAPCSSDADSYSAPHFGERVLFRTPEVDRVSGEVLALLDEGHQLQWPDGREVPVYVPSLHVHVYSRNRSVSDELLAQATLAPEQALALMQSCEMHACSVEDSSGNHAGFVEIQFCFL